MAGGRPRRGHNDRAHTAPETRLRVIGGTWRSRVLSVVDRPGLRPTPNRVRETLFNWLAPRIEGAACLDLFAGTGALGIEALSRGAASAVFVERDRIAAAAIQSALDALGASDRARVVIGDATQAARLAGIDSTDIVFIDPPFDADLHDAALYDIRPALGPRSRVYLEYPERSRNTIAGAMAADYELVRESRAAGVVYCLARPRCPSEHTDHE